MKSRFLFGVGLVLTVGLPGPAAELRLTLKELAQRAEAIRPTAAELRWQQIPWLGSLVEARAAARSEKRPVVVWTLDEDPFERC
jgi:hypothetical protein